MKYSFVKVFKSHPLSVQDDTYIRKYVYVPEGITIHWVKMREDILGCRSIFYPKRLFINSKYADFPDRLIDTVAHEVVHVIQRLRYGWFYYIRAIPYIREWTLEPEARRAERATSKMLQGLDEADRRRDRRVRVGLG